MNDTQSCSPPAPDRNGGEPPDPINPSIHQSTNPSPAAPPAFARLTTGGLKCERLLDQQAERAAQRQPAFKKGLTPETLKELNEKLRLM